MQSCHCTNKLLGSFWSSCKQRSHFLGLAKKPPNIWKITVLTAHHLAACLMHGPGGVYPTMYMENLMFMKSVRAEALLR